MTAPGRAKALLLAGGLGTRLRPLTESIPKCLIPIADRPLIDFWFSSLCRAGLCDVLINTHHHAEAVRKHIDGVRKVFGLNVVEAFEPELLGSAGTISANRSWMDDADECLVIYADNLSTIDLGAFLSFHASRGAPVTMALFRTPRPQDCGIAELDAEGRIVRFVEKPENPTSNLANAGVYAVCAEAYREMADMNGFDLAFDVLPNFRGRMRGFILDCYHRDIGNLEALEQARSDAVEFPWESREVKETRA
jgi:mannose-1-phosphate guanylyltransferase